MEQAPAERPIAGAGAKPAVAVNPGFGGQRFIPAVLDKIARLRRNFAGDIEIDGGVDATTIGSAHRAGANVFVAGTSVFGVPGGPAAAIPALRAQLA